MVSRPRPAAEDSWSGPGERLRLQVGRRSVQVSQITKSPATNAAQTNRTNGSPMTRRVWVPLVPPSFVQLLP